MSKAEKLEKIENFVETLNMPDWGYVSKVELVRDILLNIEYSNMATIYFDTKYGESGLSIREDCALGKLDLEFAIDVLENKDKIISMLN